MTDDLRASLDEVEDYEQTVRAILAFAAFVVHDGTHTRQGAVFGLGRRMHTSPRNPISPSRTVTPDLVAQKSPEYGLTAEVKKSLSKDSEHWKSHITQLRKYDDDLTGWWTEDESIGTSDAVILVHHSRSRPFTRLVRELAETKSDDIGDRSCVVEFVRSDEREPYYSFRLEFGQISDEELAARLDVAVEVPFNRVLSSFPNLKYYDSEPPLSLLLTNLWLDVFPTLAAETQRDEELKAYRVSVSVGDVAAELQRAYGSANLRADSHSVEFPKNSWVRKAFDRLVDYGLGTRPASDSDRYEVHYRRFKGDVLERFVVLEQDWESSRKRPRASQVEQLTLLLGPDSSGESS